MTYLHEEDLGAYAHHLKGGNTEESEVIVSMILPKYFLKLAHKNDLIGDFMILPYLY